MIHKGVGVDVGLGGECRFRRPGLDAALVWGWVSKAWVFASFSCGYAPPISGSGSGQINQGQFVQSGTRRPKKNVRGHSIIASSKLYVPVIYITNNAKFLAKLTLPVGR
jgi:hypothetical protein